VEGRQGLRAREFQLDPLEDAQVVADFLKRGNEASFPVEMAKIEQNLKTAVLACHLSLDSDISHASSTPPWAASRQVSGRSPEGHVRGG